MHTVDFLRSRGASSIFLDGVLRAVPLYERCGFQKVCRSLRFGGRLEGRAHAHIQAMTHDDLDEVAQLDLNAFGADRRFFLESRLYLYPYLCKVAKVDGRVAGYIMGRLGHTVLAAGPWVASDRLVRPQDLLESLALEAAMIPITIGCLADNSKSAEILRALRFSEKSDAPWRMVSGRYTQPGMVSMNFAVGSPAKG